MHDGVLWAVTRVSSKADVFRLCLCLLWRSRMCSALSLPLLRLFQYQRVFLDVLASPAPDSELRFHLVTQYLCLTQLFDVSTHRLSSFIAIVTNTYLFFLIHEALARPFRLLSIHLLHVSAGTLELMRSSVLRSRLGRFFFFSQLVPECLFMSHIHM